MKICDHTLCSPLNAVLSPEGLHQSVPCLSGGMEHQPASIEDGSTQDMLEGTRSTRRLSPAGMLRESRSNTCKAPK